MKGIIAVVMLVFSINSFAGNWEVMKPPGDIPAPDHFIIEINNQCKDLIMLAIAFDLDQEVVDENEQSWTLNIYSKGWWPVKPGIQFVKINHALLQKYYIYAKTETVFWGKDKEFPVRRLNGEIQNLKFSGHDANKKCEFHAEDGVFHCHNTYKCE